MDSGTYILERLVESRLRDLRAASARAALLRSVRSGDRGFRVTLGEALIRVGRWMLRGHGDGAQEARAPLGR